MSRLSILCLLIFPSFGLFACASSSDRESGHAVGLHAVISADSGDITSNEFEVELLSAEIEVQSIPQQIVPRSASITTSPSDAQLLARDLRSLRSDTSMATATGSCERAPSKLGTHNGKICWISEKVSASSSVNERSLTRMLYFTPEGMYHAVVEATGFQTSPSLASAGFSIGTGCVLSPTSEHVEVAYLESLLGLGFSTSIMFYNVGISTFYTIDGGLQRGFQYDSGTSFALSLIPFLDFSVSKDLESSFLVRPYRITGDCESSAAEDDELLFPNTSAQPFASIEQGLKRLSLPEPTSYRDVMLQETARSALSAIAPLAQASDTPSQGELSHAFFERSGTDLCETCADGSLDSFLYLLREELGATEGDGEATREVVRRRFGHYQASAPGALPYALVQRRSSSTLRLALLAHEDLAAKARGDLNRFVSSEIIEIDAKVGQPVTLTITADEIAQLIGSNSSSLQGAKVTIDSAPLLKAIEVELVGGSISVEVTPAQTDPILVRIDVDLADAAGPFSGDVSSWTVRPALRRVNVAAGPPAAISLGGPARSLGDVQTLTALVTDEHYAPVDSDVTVRFYDGTDEVLGNAAVVGGSAQLRVTLGASTPAVTSVEAVELTTGDDQIVEGISVTGSGWSQYADILVDGLSLKNSDAIVAVENSKTILFTLRGSGLGVGAHQLMIINPDGRHSKSMSFTIGR